MHVPPAIPIGPLVAQHAQHDRNGPPFKSAGNVLQPPACSDLLHKGPLTAGFYLVCHLVAALNPTDLDALDESVPFTKKTMEDLLGRELSPEEYARYFEL